MAACPAPLSPSQRRRFALTPRRLAANRRNAARSTGPRTPEGKARVARNAIKHGFFAAATRWSSQQQRDLQTLYADLRDDFLPGGIGEESCVWTIADAYVRMASLLRYENLAALEYHQQCDRDFDARVAAADSDETALLREHRDELRRAGLWRPTIPGPRAAPAIIRYMGRLERTIRRATSELEALKAFRNGGRFGAPRAEKQTHCSVIGAGRHTARNGKTNPLRAPLSNGPEALRRTSAATDANLEIAKTKPLNPMSNGNRHARRRAAALARRGSG
ncbi:MAG TPA: hypothetical protein VMT64_08085 [Candidatus Binataceae bacterium]|nr:hypothetical protein [Candidatus Binataceae bacterium]